MGIKYLFIYCGLALYSCSLLGQVNQPLRLEVELEREDNHYTVMSMKEKGIVLFRELDYLPETRKKAWEVVRLDTLLQNVLTKNYYLEYKAELLGYEYRANHLYLLFRMGQYQKDDLKIIKINMDTGEDVHFDIKQIVPITLTEFTIIGNAALLGGYVNYRPALIHYSFDRQKIKVLPGIYRNHSELIELNIDEETNTFAVLMTERTREKLSTISIKRFNANGDLIQNTLLEPLPNSSILYGRFTSLTNKHQFVVGTYSHKRSRYSRGIYIAHLDPNSEEKPKITYFNYGDLKNFFNYMKAKRAARVKERVERRKVQGKKIRLNYRFMVHDIIKENGNFLMIGEAFYPKYGSAGYYGSYTYFPGYQAFEGYKYTHAIIIAFDSDGKLIYDNSFEINDVLSFQLDQLVSINVQEGKIILLYTYENIIRSKIIQGDEVLEGKAFNEIELAFEDDIVGNKNSEMGGLKKWYGDYFFAYGVQKIKNLRGSVVVTREVFYINKIVYSFDSDNAETSVEGH
jgi:hypothetical protein